MIKKKTEQTGEFIATDENGEKYRITEFTEFFEAGTLINPNFWEKGLKEFRLDNGSAVNQINDTEFEIVTTGKRVKLTS